MIKYIRYLIILMILPILVPLMSIAAMMWVVVTFIKEIDELVMKNVRKISRKKDSE